MSTPNRPNTDDLDFVTIDDDADAPVEGDPTSVDLGTLEHFQVAAAEPTLAGGASDTTELQIFERPAVPPVVRPGPTHIAFAMGEKTQTLMKALRPGDLQDPAAAKLSGKHNIIDETWRILAEKLQVPLHTITSVEYAELSRGIGLVFVEVIPRIHSGGRGDKAVAVIKALGLDESEFTPDTAVLGLQHILEKWGIPDKRIQGLIGILGA